MDYEEPRINLNVSLREYVWIFLALRHFQGKPKDETFRNIAENLTEEFASLLYIDVDYLYKIDDILLNENENPK